MRFFMGYDNIPNQGPVMLFKDNGDGTSSLATPEDVNLAIAESTAHLQKLVEEQKGEIAEWKSKFENASEAWEAAGDELHTAYTEQDLMRRKLEQIESQLAEQTERVRILTEALNKAHEWACKYPLQGEPSTADMDASDDVRFACQQALNQESLGDGGKGE